MQVTGFLARNKRLEYKTGGEPTKNATWKGGIFLLIQIAAWAISCPSIFQNQFILLLFGDARHITLLLPTIQIPSTFP